MKQSQFIVYRQKTWQHWDNLVKEFNDKKFDNAIQIPKLYREICHDYTLAKGRNYSHQLQQELQLKIAEGHRLLYREKSHWLESFIMVLAFRFPATLRQYRYSSMINFGLFFGLLFVFGVICFYDQSFIYYVMEPASVLQMESMYDPQGQIQTDTRDSADDFTMFGVYILNNISIAFRTFVAGLLFGIGSLFFIIYNAIAIGCVAGYLTQLGYGSTFYSFVITHGAVELTALVIAGVAGLNLGYVLIDPGAMSRRDALIVAARKSLVLMYGATVFLLLAAFIEAFWSSADYISNQTKYIVGAGLWGLVFAYLLFAGRGYEPR